MQTLAKAGPRHGAAVQATHGGVLGGLAVAACALAALGGVGAGCASAAPMSPADVTRAQIARLVAGDEAGAAELLAPEVRVKAPQWPAQAELPSPASVVELERTAMWTGARELELVRTESGWQIRRGVLALFRLDTAEGALAAFGRALDARDFGLVTALMPEDSRKQLLPGALEKAFAAREATWRGLGRAIRESAQGGGQRLTWAARDGERAEVIVVVGDGKDAREHRLVLVRETNGWKVFDVQPWSEYIAP